MINECLRGPQGVSRYRVLRNGSERPKVVGQSDYYVLGMIAALRLLLSPARLEVPIHRELSDRYAHRFADIHRESVVHAEQNALLVSQMNWDQENALLYSARYTHPEVAWVRLFEVLPHFPYLVRDNLGIGREVVLTADAAADVVSGTRRSVPAPVTCLV